MIGRREANRWTRRLGPFLGEAPEAAAEPGWPLRRAAAEAAGLMCAAVVGLGERGATPLLPCWVAIPVDA